MEAQFYVAASALPPEAQALIDPARSLPDGVRWTGRPPTALGPVVLAISALVGLALVAAVLSPGEDTNLTAGLVALVPMGAGALWGAWTGLRWMRAASAWKAGRRRWGLFLAARFLLLHEAGSRNLLVPRERVIGAH